VISKCYIDGIFCYFHISFWEYFVILLIFFYFISAWLANKVVPSSWCCWWNGISAFHTTTSCYSRRLKNTERACWRWLGR